MPLGSLDHDHGRAQHLTEPTEEHSLMGNVGVGDDALGAELKAAWNGSVSRNWANRITKYRDTITEDSPTLNNGTLDMATTENGKGDPEDRLGSSLCSGNQVEAEVIVHSELNDLEKERQEARILLKKKRSMYSGSVSSLVLCGELPCPVMSHMCILLLLLNQLNCALS
ncbi:unnamed protein product [Oncorhynchus mykiss]|uniref:Uncharacterized protein n=1 Tax=Oncorhynchus mykiss TaxID=8022 RepID=A0A060WBI5_ONCMY|nr:unnamed protein product [Oncorhynchus mykiss]